MRSLYLNPETWDLDVDSSRNIAVAEDPYALAQNAASACRVFTGEAYYDTNLGIAYSDSVLGERPPIEFVRIELLRVSKTVAGVKGAAVYFTDFTDRTLTGQIQITDSAGQVTGINF